MPLPEFRPDGWLPVGHHDATWDEIIERFSGDAGSRRALLTAKLLNLRDQLLGLGLTGYFMLDGSYISSKPEPEDFDVLLVGPADIQARKDANEGLVVLMDAERAEKVGGYTFFYIPSDSADLELLCGIWDLSNEGIAKGVVQVDL